MAPYYSLQRELREVPWSSVTDSYPHGSMPWAERVAQYSGAPWGEIEGRYIVLTVPTDALLKLTDPRPLLEFWDTVLAHELALSGQQIKHKERVVPDQQISAVSRTHVLNVINATKFNHTRHHTNTSISIQIHNHIHSKFVHS